MAVKIWAAAVAAVLLMGVLSGEAPAEMRTFTGLDSRRSTDWHRSGNWSQRQLPTSADDAVIPSGRAAVLATGGAAVQSVVLDSGAQLNVNGQTLSVGGNGGGCGFFGGSCSLFAGVLRVLGEGSLALGGEATWSAGAWAIGRSGLDVGVGGTVENRGRLMITGNTLAASNFGVGGGVVRNLPGATITRVGSSGTATVSVPLDNDGALSVDSGTLVLQGGSGDEISAGSFALAQNAELSSMGGHRLSPGARVTGPGTLRLDSGSFEFADGIGAGGVYSPGTTLASGGELDLGGGTGSTDRLRSDGTGGGIRRGTLSVGGGVSTLDNITFDGGARVAFAPEATITASGTVRVTGSAVLGLNGGTVWSAGSWAIGGLGLDMGVSGTVENRGHLRITGNNTRAFNPSVGGAVVRNLPEATITRDTSTGAAEIAVPLENAGQVTVQSGMLIMQGDYVQTGGFTLLDNGTLRMANANRTLMIQGGVLGGSGTIEGNVALSNNASLIPGFRQLTTAGNHQLGVLTIVGGSRDEFSLGQDAGSDFEIGGRARGTEYE